MLASLSSSSADVASSMITTSGGLIEKAGEREALLLPALQREAPLRAFVEPAFKMRQAASLQGRLQHRVVTVASPFGPARAVRNGPSGINGRCSRNAMRAPIGFSMTPLPHGHRPAIARTSVLFPVPDAPRISTFCPRANSISAPAISMRPPGSAILRCFSLIEPSRLSSSTNPIKADLFVPAVDPVERLGQLHDTLSRCQPLRDPYRVVGQPIE